METKRDELSKVAAIWILASTDENPIITFKSVIERVGYENENEVLNVILKYRELFRHKAQTSQLDKLKNQWRSQQNTDILPTWLQNKTTEDKERLIDEVSRDTVFRSILRTNYSAPKSSQGSIDWGLRHIDSLRKIESDKTDKRFRNYHLVLTTVSLAVTLATIYIGYKNNKENLQFQWRMKYYETTLKPKQENYTQFMSAMYDAYEGAIVKDGEQMLSKQKEMQRSYSMLEVFLDSSGLVNDARATSLFASLCDTVYKTRESDHFSKQFVDLRLYFRNRLYGQLFGNSTGSSLDNKPD